MIKFPCKKVSTLKEMFKEISSGFQNSSPSNILVKKYPRLFQQKRETSENDSRPGRLVKVVTEENF